jgi:predicted nuclease of predicted toxin-antitoxin system
VSLQLLLDENMPWDVAEGLRSHGYDVVAIASSSPGIDDRAILELAAASDRWLLTMDSDFGELIFHGGSVSPPALLYFRLHPISSAELLTLALAALSGDCGGHLSVITRESIRRRPLPGSDEHVHG